MTTTKKEEHNINEIDVCPNCGSTKLVSSPERGEITCIQCGTVIRTKTIDPTPEWRAFTTEEIIERTRVGPPNHPSILIPSSISADIDWRSKDANGKRLSLKQRMEALRLRKWQKINITNTLGKNLIQASDEADRLTSILGLPQTVRDEALLIYKKAVEMGLAKGRSINSLITAALYAACRKTRIPITLDEFTKHSKSNDRKEIARCYRLLIKYACVHVSPADPTDYVEKITNLLNMKPEVQTHALEIIKKAKEKRLTTGKDPAGFAAAAVYIAGLLHGEHRKQKEFAQAAQVTEVVIRTRYKEIIRKLNIKELPQNPTTSIL